MTLTRNQKLVLEMIRRSGGMTAPELERALLEHTGERWTETTIRNALKSLRKYGYIERACLLMRGKGRMNIYVTTEKYSYTDGT
ncbi:MAG: hypothetical protein QHG98_07210 [Methanothrix sp.]|jgi:Fe2+ or Zn2+ uptake regulation protein|nr:hypothetical protein [Methanothrix sp.]